MYVCMSVYPSITAFACDQSLGAHGGQAVPAQHDGAAEGASPPPPPRVPGRGFRRREVSVRAKATRCPACPVPTAEKKRKNTRNKEEEEKGGGE